MAGPTIKAEEVQKAHRAALKTGSIDKEQADLIWWLYEFAWRNKLSNGRVQTMLGYKTDITRVYKLTYGASLDNICAAIVRIRENQVIIEERRQYGDERFIENVLWDAVWDTCHAARVTQTIAGIWGEPQTGKSESLKEVARRKPDTTTYIEIDSGMTFKEFLQLVAHKLGASETGSIGRIRQAIYERLNPEHLLIFDEVHQVFLTCGKGTRLKILETIRSFHDKCPGGKMGIVICGTNTLRDEFTTGLIEGVLAQTYKRGIIKVQCPDVLPMREVWKFTESFHLSRPVKGSDEYRLVEKINKENGIGMFTQYLRDGAGYAAARKEKYCWQHFIDVRDGTVRYSQPGWWN